MKKFYLLLLFFLSSLIGIKAQESATITYNSGLSTQYQLTFTVIDGGGKR